MKNKLNRLEKEQTVSELKISENNKKLIDTFISDYISHLDNTRINKYKYSLIRFAHLIEKDFNKISEDDTQKINAVIGKSDLSARTLQDFVAEVKNFYKRMYGKGRNIPDNIFCLKAPKSKGKLKLPEEMPDEKDIYRMIKACNNPRDEFLIALIGLDGALRPVECRRAVWGDVKKDQYGHFIIIHTAKKSGDKETRVVRIIKSEPYFIRWCNEYPAERTDNAPLFVNFADLKPMSQGTISALFNRLKKKLKLKVMYPYLLRHGFITRASKDPQWTESLLKKFIGHSLKSNTISEYRHFGDDDLKDIQLQVNGIVKKNFKKEPDRKPIKCPKCSKSNEYDAEFCYFCNMALTQKRLVEVNEKQEASNKLLYILAKKELEGMKGKERAETEEVLKMMEKSN
ncbi:MAG: site-specific integrase [Nanoarchaeota archaeon]|nr:site-specific integrase [Nanoarchaeota archaeon]